MSLANIRAAFEALGYRTRNTSEGFASQCAGSAHAHNAKSGFSANFTVKNGHVLMHCKSHGCDRFEVVENLGLPVSELYPDGKFDRKQYAIKKSQQQIENECIHAYNIIIQLPSMKKNGIKPDIGDVLSIKKSLAILKKYNFTEVDYLAIEERKQKEVDERRLIECERALDDSYDRLMEGGRHEF